jgi:hypothetical protein
MAYNVFGRMFQRTAASNVLRQFGETVTYYPADGSPAREVTATVERGELQVISETGSHVGDYFTIRCLNSSDGIEADEVDTGGDEISLPVRVNEEPQRRTIVRVIGDSNGFTRLLCQ